MATLTLPQYDFKSSTLIEEQMVFNIQSLTVRDRVGFVCTKTSDFPSPVKAGTEYLHLFKFDRYSSFVDYICLPRFTSGSEIGTLKFVPTGQSKTEKKLSELLGITLKALSTKMASELVAKTVLYFDWNTMNLYIYDGRNLSFINLLDPDEEAHVPSEVIHQIGWT